MPPSDYRPREPEDFADFLDLPEPPLLVGGQAVNLWALHYGEETEGLAPFVSRDVDLLGKRQTLSDLAARTGTRPQFFPLKPPSNSWGVVIAEDARGDPLLIEVLRYANGVSNEDLEKPAYTFVIGTGVHVRVPGPIALLKAKIANASDLPQADRQDEQHVVILCRLMPAYLSDLEHAAAHGKTTERAVLTLLEYLLQVITAEKAKTVLHRHGINRESLFSPLSNSVLPKIQAFYKQRLPRALGR